MRWSIEACEAFKAEIAEWIPLQMEGLITDQEVAVSVLAKCGFALEADPEHAPLVAVAFDRLPSRILVRAASTLDKRQRPEGRWIWPPVGIVIGAREFRPADERESTVWETLAKMLRARTHQNGDCR